MNGLKKILSRQKTNQSGDHEGELKAFRDQHRYDPFLDEDKLRAVDSALDSGNAEKLRDLDNNLIQDDSPYPEVRAAVRLPCRRASTPSLVAHPSTLTSLDPGTAYRRGHARRHDPCMGNWWCSLHHCLGLQCPSRIAPYTHLH